MATSGTVAQTTIRVVDLVTKAILRCGYKTSDVTPEILDQARLNLYFYITSVANTGINLWTIEKTILGLYPYQAGYYLPAGTIDVLNANYRTTVRYSGDNIYSSAGGTAENADDGDIDTVCTQTSTNGNIYIDLESSVAVITVGIMTNGDQTYNLVWEWSSDNSTWTSVYSPGSADYADKTWYWHDIVAPVAARYFRVRETGGGTLNVREVVFGTNISEYPVSRLNRDDYTNLPNKMQTNQYPLQFWFDRLIPQPQMLVWPVPIDTFVTLVVWRHRQVEDVGAFTNELEFPTRWAEALISNLAARMSLELPGVSDERIILLGKLASSADDISQTEERDKSPISFAPNIRPYTA